MALTTLLGTAQLTLQNALSTAVDAGGAMPRVPNFVRLSLKREAFLRQYTGPLAEERERFRREIMEGARSYLAANGWRIGGTGTLVVNILLRAIETDCEVRLETLDALYTLGITDDEGKRSVPVKAAQTIIGREHEPHPRGFVALHDRTRVISREHLRLVYTDLELALHLLGANVTTLNGDRIGDGSGREPAEGIKLHAGDVIACGRCQIVIENL